MLRCYHHRTLTLSLPPFYFSGGSSKRSSMHKVVMKQLTKLGINVINNDYIEDVNEDYMGGPKTFTTKKGVKIDADVVIVCVGARPNIPFPVGDDAIDETTRGLVVNGAMLCENIGVDPTKPVWAIGDCTQYGGRGMFADTHIKAMSASMVHFEKHGSTKAGPMSYKHKPSEECPCLVSVGRRGGAITLPFPNAMLGRALKSKDLGLKFIYNAQFKVKL
jgi:NADH dehydrogenase FAD-containing subunit